MLKRKAVQKNVNYGSRIKGHNVVPVWRNEVLTFVIYEIPSLDELDIDSGELIDVYIKAVNNRLKCLQDEEYCMVDSPPVRKVTNMRIKFCDNK